MAAKRYTVTYERDETGWWISRVQGVKGVHSNGRTIAESRRRVREALSLAIGDEAAERAEFIDEPRFPGRVGDLLARHGAARKDLDDAQGRAIDLARQAAHELSRLGLSVRDIGDLLGLSHTRAQQLVNAADAEGGAARGTKTGR